MNPILNQTSYLLHRRQIFEREIRALQEQVEEINDEKSIAILEKARELQRENDALK